MFFNIRTHILATNRRLIHASPRALYADPPSHSNPPSHDHTADSYAKEVDSTPPSDSSVHRLDPDSDNVQKPHEPPSGEWSRAGTRTKEYEEGPHGTVNKDVGEGAKEKGSTGGGKLD